MAPIGGVRAGYLSAGKDAIPDSADVLYNLEGDGSDAAGSNDLSINSNHSFVSDPAVGDQALDTDGANISISQNTVDASTEGDSAGFAVFGWVKEDTMSDGHEPFSWGVDNSNYLIVLQNNGNYRARAEINGSQTVAASSVSVSDTSYLHIYIEVNTNDVRIVVHDTDGTVLADVTDSHGQTVSNISGDGNISAGGRASDVNHADCQIDDIGLSFDPLTDTEIDELVSRV